MRFTTCLALFLIVLGCGTADRAPSDVGALAPEDLGTGFVPDGGDPLDAADAAPDELSLPDVAAAPDDGEPASDGGADVVPPDLGQPDPPETVTGPPGDEDGDGVPNQVDLFPKDPKKPGTVLPGKVYMHTASALFILDVKTYKINKIGDFGWPNDGVFTHEMTDIAVDRYGVIYGVAFTGLYVCDPNDASCTSIGTSSASFNALTWIPAGILDPVLDVLVGVAGSSWYRLNKSGSVFTPVYLGDYGGGYSSSGDVFSIAGVGTFATVNKLFAWDDFVVEVDPKTGKVLKEVGQLPGYTSMFGVAGWNDRVFAFDETGKILVLDIDDGKVLKEIVDTNEAWWGAGVPTVIPP